MGNSYCAKGKGTSGAAVSHSVFSLTSILSIIGLGHANNIPTMQSFTGIFRDTQSKSYMLKRQTAKSLTECVWEFRNDGLCGTH